MKKGNKVIFIDIMLKGRFVFTLRYEFCPIFKLDMKDVYNKIIEKRPTLKVKPIELYFD